MPMTPRFFATAALLSLTLATPAFAEQQARLVDCRIESEGKVQVSGKCRFIPEEGGTFGLENADRNKPLYGEILMITVAVIAPSKAEVRGLTRYGINSRWGAAQRSNDDRACWVGSDFKICAR